MNLRSALAMLGAALVVTVTACGGGGGGGGTTQPPTGTTQPSTGATRPPTAAPTTTPAIPTCATSVLAAEVVDSDGAAGSVYLRLTLTNTSSARCTLGGYPGVSFVDSAGKQLGASADWNGDVTTTLVLEGGGKAEFTVQVTQPGLRPGCDTEGSYVDAASLRVYPPDNTVALLVPLTAGNKACSNPAVHQLRVSGLTAAG